MKKWRGRAARFPNHLIYPAEDQNLRFSNPIYDLTLKFMPYHKTALVSYIIMFELPGSPALSAIVV